MNDGPSRRRPRFGRSSSNNNIFDTIILLFFPRGGLSQVRDFVVEQALGTDMHPDLSSPSHHHGQQKRMGSRSYRKVVPKILEGNTPEFTHNLLLWMTFDTFSCFALAFVFPGGSSIHVMTVGSLQSPLSIRPPGSPHLTQSRRSLVVLSTNEVDATLREPCTSHIYEM